MSVIYMTKHTTLWYDWDNTTAVVYS